MTEEAKIIWGGELWAPPTILQEVDNHRLVGAYLSRNFIEGKYTVPLYTHPLQRTWVGLTDEGKEFIAKRASVYDWHDYEVIEATEAYLKEKNT